MESKNIIQAEAKTLLLTEFTWRDFPTKKIEPGKRKLFTTRTTTAAAVKAFNVKVDLYVYSAHLHLLPFLNNTKIVQICHY